MRRLARAKQLRDHSRTTRSGGLGYFPETWQAFDLIQQRYIANNKLGPVCFAARVYRHYYAGTERLLRLVMEKNPDRNVQGIACFTLAGVLRDYAELAEALKEPAKGKLLEQGFPMDIVQKLRASDPEKLRKEAEDLYQRALDKYGDVHLYAGSVPLREMVEATLFEMRYLQIGKTAPEIQGEDIDGTKLKLSGLIILIEDPAFEDKGRVAPIQIMVLEFERHGPRLGVHKRWAESGGVALGDNEQTEKQIRIEILEGKLRRGQGRSRNRVILRYFRARLQRPASHDSSHLSGSSGPLLLA